MSSQSSMDDNTSKIDLPGFRFHPTEEEILEFYLKNMIYDTMFQCDVIGFLNIYRHDPWDLPGLSRIGEREWYFFVPRDRKHGSGGRPNRTTENGFWKATGSDRKIVSLSEPKRVIGLKKTLVFYKGRAPRGSKTDWVMNEYRLPDGRPLPKDVVLCKVYRKATSLKVLEQRAAKEEELKFMKNNSTSPSSPLSSSMETVSFCGPKEDLVPSMSAPQMLFKKEIEEEEAMEEKTSEKRLSSSSLQLPLGSEKLPELQMPKMLSDWTQDQFWAQLNSPWFQNLTTYANILNF